MQCTSVCNACDKYTRASPNSTTTTPRPRRHHDHVTITHDDTTTTTTRQWLTITRERHHDDKNNDKLTPQHKDVALRKRIHVLRSWSPARNTFYSLRRVSLFPDHDASSSAEVFAAACLLWTGHSQHVPVLINVGKCLLCVANLHRLFDIST